MLNAWRMKTLNMANGRIDQVFGFPEIKAQFDAVFKLMDELARRIEKLDAAAMKLNLGGGKGSNREATQGVVNAANELERAEQRLAKAQSELGRQLASVNEKTRQQGVANRQAAREAATHSTSLDGMRARLAGLTREYDKLSAAQRNNTNVGGRMLKNIQQLQKEVRELELATGRAQRNVGNYPKQLVGGIQGFLSGAGLGAGLGIAGTGVLAREIFNTTMQLDSMNIALQAVSGSTEEFNRNQAYLVSLSERLGLNLLNLTSDYKTFYAASTQAGLSADETRKIFERTASAGARLRLSNEQINGAFTAMSQIISKGKVQAEELRGQLAERIPGAFSIAARAIGVTEQELNKMLEKGEVIASEFLPKFARELERTYGVNGPVEGLQASTNRLSNALTKLVSDNGSGLTRFFTWIVDGATRAATSLGKVVNYVTDIYDKIQLVRRGGETITEGTPFDQKVLEKYQDADLTTLLNDLTAVNKEVIRISENAEKGFNVDEEKLNKLFTQQKIMQKLIDENLQKSAEAAGRTSGGISDKERKAMEKAAQDASRLRELQLKAILEARQIDLESAIQSQKEIAENEKLSFSERLIALGNYNTLRNLLASETLEHDKKILSENVKQGQAATEQITVLEKKAAQARQQIAKDTGRMQRTIFMQNVDARLQDILVESERVKAEYERAAAEELSTLQKQLEGRNVTQEQYEFLELQIRNKYATMALQAEIEATKKIIEIRKARGEDVRELETALFKAQTDLGLLDLELFKKREKQKTEVTKEEAEKRTAEEKQALEAVQRLGQELQEFFWTAAGARFENEKNRLSDEIELIRKRKQEEIDAINATTLSAQEKADRIAVVNAKAQADEEQIEARKRQVQIEQAKFERAQAIAAIILNTSVAAIKVIGQAGIAGIPLSAIVAAIGAVQLAAALAAPIPRYRTGRKGGPAEWAYLNDGGVDEVVEKRSGQAYIPKGRNILAHLDEGDTVHPSVAAYKAARERVMHRRAPSMHIDASGILRVDTEAQTNKIVAAIQNNKSTVVVQNTWGGLTVTKQNVSGWIEYLNKHGIVQ